MAFFLIGRCLGLKSRDRKDKQGKVLIDRETGQVMKEWEVGFACPVPGGYEDEMTTVSIRVSQQQEQTGILSLYANARGKDLMVAVWCQPWVGRNGTPSLTWRLSGDGRPYVAPVLKSTPGVKP